MPIRVQCLTCKTTLAVKDHLAGKRVRCPKCQNPLAVPATPPAGAAPAAKPTPKVGAPLPVKPAATKTKAPVGKPAGKPPVEYPPPENVEDLAAAALRDELAPPPPPNGANGANGHATTALPPIKFNCDFCDAEIELPAEMAGKREPCPQCSRINKVPVPKVEKPKDWRTAEKKGPSLAAINQPEKMDNAWGTETTGKVSQKALLEAGVIQKPKKPSIGVWGWVERGIKYGVLAAIAIGVGLLILNLGKINIEKEHIDQLAKKSNDKWPAVIQGEFHIGVADLALKQPGNRDMARLHDMHAWQKNPATEDPRDTLDRDALLIRLALAQVKLGGSDDDIALKDRFAWNQEVFEDIDRTVKLIDSPDARACAVRELAISLTAKQKPDIASSLVSSVAKGTPQAKSVQIAMLWADDSKQAEAKSLAPYPDGRKIVDIVTRCGYAEGLARQGKIKEAIDLAQAPGQPAHKFQALMAVGAWLAHDSRGDAAADLKRVCDEAGDLLKKDPKANIAPWVLLEHVRLTARVDADESKALAQKLPANCKRRGQVEVALVLIDKGPPPLAEASALIHALDKDGPGRGLAWLALAQARARANQSFTFEPEDPEEESLRDFFQAAEAFRSGPVK